MCCYSLCVNHNQSGIIQIAGLQPSTSHSCYVGVITVLVSRSGGNTLEKYCKFNESQSHVQECLHMWLLIHLGLDFKKMNQGTVFFSGCHPLLFLLLSVLASGFFPPSYSCIGLLFLYSFYLASNQGKVGWKAFSLNKNAKEAERQIL